MRQGSENFFWPPQFFQIFADFSPSNCSSSKTVPSFSFSFFFPKSQDPYVLPGQKIVKKAYFGIFIFFDEFSGLYTDLRPRMGYLNTAAAKTLEQVVAAPGLGKLLFLPSVLCELDFCPWAGAWLGGAGRDALGRAARRGGDQLVSRSK